MKTPSRAFLPALLVAPFLLASRWAPENPGYSPKAGSSITKHFSADNELELEDMSLEVNGADMSDQAGQIEVAMKVGMKLGVVDKYEAVADGRPTKLKRTFEEISSNTHVSGSNPMLGNQEQDIPLASKLEGTTVVFTWDEGDSSYNTAFDGKDGDESLLEGLEESLDLRGFLPGHEVASGDTWEIPADAVRSALAPGGDIKLRPEGDSDPMSRMNQFSQNDMIGNLEGKFQATFGGTRDEEGVKVAVIKLAIDAKSARDMTSQLDDIREQMKGQMPEGVTFDLTAMDGEYAIDAEGELLWNLEAGMPHSLHLSGEVHMIVDMSMSMQMGENEQNMDISQTFAGNTTITMSVGE